MLKSAMSERPRIMRNPERALYKIVGEVHALFMAVQVLAKTHSNPAVAKAELEIAEQLGLAAIEPHPIDDAVLIAYQDTVKGIRQSLLANPLYSQGHSS
jgi:hypothetical protein